MVELLLKFDCQFLKWLDFANDLNVLHNYS